MSACSGSCCALFYIGSDNAQLMRELARHETQQDIYVESMLLELYGPNEAGPPPEWRDRISYGWTCKHFDGQLCTDYENRPPLCRQYPNGHACKKPDCNYDGPETQLYQIGKPIPKFTAEEVEAIIADCKAIAPISE